MAKEKRSNWLDKISKWILGALPEERASASSSTRQQKITSLTSSQQKPTQPRPIAEPPNPPSPEVHEISQRPTHQAAQIRQQSPPHRQPVAAVASSSAPQQIAPTGNTINQAWRAFERAWADAGLSDRYFLEREEREQTLAVLDRSFEEELIEWLFQLCTKPEALRDLAGIIERGQVRPTDNIDAIRAFAYVSVAISARPKPSSPPSSSEQSSLRPAALSQAEESAGEEADLRTPETDVADEFERPRQGIGNIPIEELELSIRTYNCLKRVNIYTLLDLAGKDEKALIGIKNFGQKSVDEVKHALARKGLTLPFKADDIRNGSESNDGLNNDSQEGAEDFDDLRSLGLAPRTLNCLLRSEIYTITELCLQTESGLLLLQNLGRTGVAEIRTRLQVKGLSLADGEQFPTSLETQQPPSQLDPAWAELKKLVAEQAGHAEPSFELLSQISARNSNNQACAALSDVLQQLKAILIFIGDTLSAKNPEHSDAISNALALLMDCIAVQILDSSNGGASQWVQRITKSFAPNLERNWLVYLLHCSGKTLSSIAEGQQPPISRERVRQMESKISKIVGVKPSDISQGLKAREEAEQRQQELAALQSWMTRLGRLPILADHKEASIDDSPFWQEVCAMDLNKRIALLSKYQLDVSDAEFDFHYTFICNQMGSVGTGYWRDFENLKQFVHRHAAALGEPELMPKQTSFPRGVAGIVQSYGGQSKVAKRLGLQYQGQLIGTDGGRRYWTDERLETLLVDANRHHDQEVDLMPSYGQILEFFSATEISEYHDKKPHSAIAALSKMGSLHWSEVAQRFNKRFVSGESQKSVTLSYIKAFVRDLGEHLDSLTPSELFVLFQAQGINRGEKEKFSRTFDALVDAVQSGMVNNDELRSWADNNQVASIEDLLELGSELKAETSIEGKEQKLLERRSQKLLEDFPEPEGESQVTVADLPSLEPVNILRALDKAGDIIDNSASDSDKVEFLKAKAAAKLWDACFQDEEELISKLKAVPTNADSYSKEVQEAFLDEYAGARALPIPDSYAFRDLKGRPREPKLMQRLVAFRLERDFRLLNLSGTGTGKTLSAIYAAQICGCQRIFISCPNGVIESWRRAFSSAFPAAHVIVKPDGWSLDGIQEGVNVVIVNHERFQDRFAQDLLGFCINYQADMIVIDEIHQSKRRSADTSSQRRKLMNEFIRISSNINTDLRVLGLSATPVINNLYEGRSLLELICQESIEDVGEQIDLNACMNLYQHFVVHGIRMNPGQLPRTKLIYQEVDATALLPQILRATKKGSYHDIEQLLVEPKIASLKSALTRGEKTVIFVTYIKNTLRPLTRWLRDNDYSFSVYTGDEKDAQEEGFVDSLDEFIRGRSEVLVASVQCAGTGIDGLQAVCNRAVFFQLPWTSTEFEQAIGRLDRDGTDFDSISVHIPITDIALPDGQRWSWCRSKLDRIESKRDIAKAAVDGEIPDAATLISPGEASRYWLNWLEKLEQPCQQAIPSPATKMEP